MHPPSGRKRKKAPTLADGQRKKRAKPATSHTPLARFVDNTNSEGTSVKRRRVLPASKFDAVIELDSTSDSDRTPPPPRAIFLSQSKPAQKGVQPRGKHIRAGDVIDLCSDDDTVVSMGRRDNRLKSSEVLPSKQKATGMIKSRKVIVLSSGDEVDTRGCQSQQPNLDHKRGRHVGRKRDTPHRTPAHKFGLELPHPESVVESDIVELSPGVDCRETEDHHPTFTQEFFNSLYKDSLQKPLSDLPIGNKVFYPRLPPGFRSPPRVVRKITPKDQSETLASLKSESRSFFTRVISTLNKINDRTRKSSRASPVCGGREQETRNVQMSVDRELEHAYPEPEVVANPVTPRSATFNTIQVTCPNIGDTIMGQRGEVTGPMTSDVSGHIKNPERSQDEVKLTAAHISPIFRICDPSIFELEHLPNLTWPILLGHTKNA